MIPTSGVVRDEANAKIVSSRATTVIMHCRNFWAIFARNSFGRKITLKKYLEVENERKIGAKWLVIIDM